MAEHDEALDAIQLKGSGRDHEQVAQVLGEWLGPRLGARGSAYISDLSTPGGTGVANETLLFRAAWNDGHNQRDERFVARLASETPLYLDADIEVHAKIYDALADAEGVPVPKIYGYEADREVLGAPFFVMEHMDGEVPGDQPSWRESGFIVDATPEQRRALWDEAVDVLAALHQVDVSRFDFLASHDGSSGLRDHLNYWRRYLDDASRGEQHDVLEEAYEWLVSSLPTPQPTGFSWGDSRFANYMFREGHVVSIFDWDTASLAGPEADLAWWRFMDGPASGELAGIGSADELVTRWESLTGRKVQHLEFYDVFTTFRLGAILMKLFDQMGAAGAMPAEDARRMGRESAPTLALKEQLSLYRS